MAVVKQPISSVITGHKAVRDALRDTGRYSSDLQGDEDVRDYRQLPLEVDPPRHHLYRSALTPFFVRPTIEAHAPTFRANAGNLLKEYFASPHHDVMADLALPLVMHNLGAIYNRVQDVEEWISWGPDVWTAGGPTRDGATLHAYLDRIYEEAMIGELDDVWQKIAHMEIEGKEISALEFRGIAGVMLAGGRDTVVKLFTGIMWHFAKRPEDLDSLSENPELIGGAIQEFLRFFTPLPQMARIDTTKNDYVGMSFISGNFDPSVFENPFTLDISRGRISHLSFGFGPHTCLGNHVAEIEAKVFIETLIESGLRWRILEEEIRFHSAPYELIPETFESLKLVLK